MGIILKPEKSLFLFKPSVTNSLFLENHFRNCGDVVAARASFLHCCQDLVVSLGTPKYSFCCLIRCAFPVSTRNLKCKGWCRGPASSRGLSNATTICFVVAHAASQTRPVNVASICASRVFFVFNFYFYKRGTSDIPYWKLLFLECGDLLLVFPF